MIANRLSVFILLLVVHQFIYPIFILLLCLNSGNTNSRNFSLLPRWLITKLMTRLLRVEVIACRFQTIICEFYLMESFLEKSDENIKAKATYCY